VTGSDRVPGHRPGRWPWACRRWDWLGHRAITVASVWAAAKYASNRGDAVPRSPEVPLAPRGRHPSFNGDARTRFEGSNFFKYIFNVFKRAHRQLQCTLKNAMM